MSLLIRRAEPSDAPAIAWVRIASWRAAYEGILSSAFLASLSLKERSERWEKAVTGDYTRTHVALSEDNIVGFICIGPGVEVPTELAGRLPGFIYTLYIHPESWRRSIGANLISTASLDMLEDYDEPFLWVFAKKFSWKTFLRESGLHL